MNKKLMSKNNQVPPIAIAMVVDAWFPDSKSNKKGVYGGGQVHVRELSKKLQSKYSCVIDIFYDSSANTFARILWSLVAPFSISLKVKKRGYQIIHSHGFNAGFVAKVASMLTGTPVVHTVHGSHLLDQKKKGFKAKLEQWLLTKIHYDAQISVSSTFLAYKRATKSIYIIRNGVNIKDFDQIKAKKKRNPTIIWVGRADKVKALSILKNAFSIVKKTLPNAQLELISGGRKSGMSLIQAYKQAWVFCLPSFAEGQPITLLEAWAAKLPVVVSRVGDNPKMVKHGVNGYLVAPGNADSLAQELLKLLQSPQKSKRLGTNGYNLVKNNYTWDEVAKQTYKVYVDLLQSREKRKSYAS